MDWVKNQVQKAKAAVGGSGADDFIGKTVKMPSGRSVRVRKDIAEGGFGIVYLVQDGNGEGFALKRMIGTEREHVAEMRKEIRCMKQLSSPGHQNVIKLVDAHHGPAGAGTEYLLLMELCSGGTLANVIERQALSVGEVLSSMQQCTASVQYLHQQSPPIVHRDIKLENFLLTDQGTIKLCDFGSVTSRVITPDTMQFKEISMASEEMQRNTTPMNRTPEMLQMNDAHGKAVGLPGDIWALGTSLYMLCFRNHPFPDGAVMAITNAKYLLARSTKYDPLMPLLKGLLSVDPAQRPSAAGLLAHIAKMAEAGLKLASLAGLAKIAGSGSLSNGGSGNFGSGMLQRAKEVAVSKAQNMAKAAKKRLQSNDTNNHGGIAGDLDITYVCPKLIAMAGPGEGITARNDVTELAAFIAKAHPGQACVFDLAERPNYDKDKLGNCQYRQCSLAGPPTSPPRLNTLYVICTAIQNWLLADSKNVAIIHCSNGKEITGTVIAAYMAFCSLTSSTAAVRLFHLKRMFNGKPVISPSQLRYVSYISQIAAAKLPHRRSVKITKLLFKTIPKFKLNSKAVGCRPYIDIYWNGEKLTSTKGRNQGANEGVLTTGVELSASIPIDAEARCGNLAVVCYHEQFSLIGHGTSVEMFSFYCHTGFLKDNGLTLQTHELDIAGKHRGKFDDSFMVRLETQVLNKQGKKELPWEKTKPKPKLTTDQTFFFTTQERELFMHDLEHTMRGLTEYNVTSAASIDSMAHISDDEDEMRDAMAIATPSPQSPAASAAPAPAPTPAPALAAPVGLFGGSSGDLLGGANLPTADLLGVGSATAPVDLLGSPAALSNDLLGGPSHGSPSRSPERPGASARKQLTEVQMRGKSREEIAIMKEMLAQENDMRENANQNPDQAEPWNQHNMAPVAAAAPIDLLGGMSIGGPVASNASASGGGGGSLVDFGTSAPAAAATPDPFGGMFDSPASSAPASSGSSDLLGDLFGAPSQPAAAPVVAPATQANDPFGGLSFTTSAPASSGMGGMGGVRVIGGIGGIGGMGNHQNGMNGGMHSMGMQQNGMGGGMVGVQQNGGMGMSGMGGGMGMNGMGGGMNGMNGMGPMGGMGGGMGQSSQGARASLDTLFGGGIGGTAGRTVSQPTPSSSSSTEVPPIKKNSSSNHLAAAPKKGGFGSFADFDPFKDKKEASAGKETMAEAIKKERLKTEDPDAIKVEEWANGKKKNIRTLLSTLHEILPSGTKWKILSLGDLFDPKKVQRWYLKASLVIHPDKVSRLAPEHQNLARYIWDEINEAHILWKDEGET